MVQRTAIGFASWQVALFAAVMAVVVTSPARGQSSPFQIVWVVIGEASSVSDQEPAHAGRQLFMAADLAAQSLANVKIEQVEIVPAIQQLALGQRLCVTQLDIRTFGQGQRRVGAAPLSISVRQDHKHQLGLSRGKRDICLQPRQAGEYPVRLTSMLPASDGTTRGAQLFIRVSNTNKPDEPPKPAAKDIP